MIYLDMSFIAPLVINEPHSTAVETRLSKVKPGELVTSCWTQVEFAGLIARKLQMGELDAAEAAAVRTEFQEILDESFVVILPTVADYHAARDYLEIPRTGMRAADALHLAIAANRSAQRIWSLDQGFVRAGKRLNLPVGVG